MSGKTQKKRRGAGRKKKKLPTLLNPDCFKPMEEKRTAFLRSLTYEKAVSLSEALLTDSILNELWDNFFPDEPVALNIILKTKHA